MVRHIAGKVPALAAMLRGPTNRIAGFKPSLRSETPKSGKGVGGHCGEADKACGWCIAHRALNARSDGVTILVSHSWRVTVAIHVSSTDSRTHGRSKDQVCSSLRPKVVGLLALGSGRASIAIGASGAAWRISRWGIVWRSAIGTDRRHWISDTADAAVDLGADYPHRHEHSPVRIARSCALTSVGASGASE